MSFKREGDDSSWLNLLKKRRVSELFAVDIPESEAKLLSNGRFMCVICHNRPIFDTVQMLSIHRSGRKHRQAMEIFPKDGYVVSDQGKKLNNEKNCLLHTPTYDYRVSNFSKINQKNVEHVIKCKNNDHLTKLKEVKEEVNFLRKNNDDNHQILKIKPYVSKHKRHENHCMMSYDMTLSFKKSFTDQLNNDGKSETKCPENSSGTNQLDQSSHSMLKNTSNSNDCKTSTSILTLEQKELFLKAFENGWKRSNSGEWVKNENVEFDSDDEPPSF